MKLRLKDKCMMRCGFSVDGMGNKFSRKEVTGITGLRFVKMRKSFLA